MKTVEDLNELQRQIIQTTEMSYRDLQADILRKIDNLEKELVAYRNSLEVIQKLKYAPGTVVIHKDFGNGIVLCPHLPELTNFAFDISKLKDIKSGDLLYVINFIKHTGRDYTYTKEVVKEEELMPYNDSSKILYGE